MMKILSLLTVSALSLSPVFADHHNEKKGAKPPVEASHVGHLTHHGFTALLNGNSLAGWTRKGSQADFSIKDGVITGHGKDLRGNSFLCSDKRYGDFIFVFQMKFDHLKGNSGCMFRANQREGSGRVFGYQCEHDNTKRGWTAGIYDEARRGWIAPSRQDKGPAGEAYRQAFTDQGNRIFKPSDWNTIVIKCQGNRIQIWMNDELRVDFTDNDAAHKTAEGFFGLQVHGGKSCDVRWRNLYIQELPKK